jgi:lipid-A-disaccharide synthase
MAKVVDHVLALLPFEPPYMEAAGMSCDFVGHPAVTLPQATAAEMAALRDELAIAPGQPVLALLPGSRRGEVGRLAPVFAEVALAASGTVSLELAAAGTPMVIAYDASPLTAMLVKRLVRIDTATLVNLVTGTRAVPEYLFENCTAERITPAVEALLDDAGAASAQRVAAEEAMLLLGRGGEAPGLRAARSVLRTISAA